MRIVSLLPSATEIICALGLREQLVGVTHECDYPPDVRDLPVVTRSLIDADAASAQIDRMVREQLQTGEPLYTLDYAALEALAPDLIVTQALCDVCAVAEAEVREAACRLPGSPRVLNLEPASLAEVLETILTVGEATGTETKARDVATSLRVRVDTARSRTDAIPPVDRPRVAFLEWIEPLFNGGHWTPEFVEIAGGRNVLGSPGVPSRALSWAELQAAAPDVIFIACCGYSAQRALRDVPMLTGRQGFDRLPAARSGRVYVTDGNAYFSRPGPRLVDGLELMAHALHPAIHPPAAGAPAAMRAAAVPAASV